MKEIALSWWHLFLIVIGNIIANYRCLGQDIFLIRETVLMAICSLSQNRGFCLFSKSAVLSLFKLGDFVSFSKSPVLFRFQNCRFCLIQNRLFCPAPESCPYAMFDTAILSTYSVPFSGVIIEIENIFKIR